MKNSTWAVLGTEWLLEQWGAWARVPDEARLGYPNKTNFAKFLGSSIKSPEIEIETALIVDSAIKLSSIDFPDYEIVLVERYVKRRTQIQLARRLHTTRREAVEILHKAESWIDGYLRALSHLDQKQRELEKPAA